MREAFIPEVPTKVTREQLIEATLALGLEPYTVRSIHITAAHVTVELNIYGYKDPALSDRHAFLKSGAHSIDPGTTITFPVVEPRPWEAA